MVTLTGCSMYLASLPVVRIMSAKRPAAAFSGILNLMAVSRLFGDFDDEIVLAVGEVHLGHQVLLQVLTRDGDHIPLLPVGGIDGDHSNTN